MWVVARKFHFKVFYLEKFLPTKNRFNSFKWAVNRPVFAAASRLVECERNSHGRDLVAIVAHLEQLLADVLGVRWDGNEEASGKANQNETVAEPLIRGNMAVLGLEGQLHRVVDVVHDDQNQRSTTDDGTHLIVPVSTQVYSFQPTNHKLIFPHFFHRTLICTNFTLSINMSHDKNCAFGNVFHFKKYWELNF